MRHHLWIAIVSAVIAGTACKKTDDGIDKAEERVEEARDNVNTQRGDLRDEMKDVEAEAKDVREENRDLAEAKADLAAARATYAAELRARLARVDARITELEGRSDADSKQAAVRLRERRDALAVEIDRVDDHGESGWDELKADLAKTFDSIEKDVAESLD